MIIDGRQVASLISVHDRGSLSDVYGLIHLSLVPVGFTGQYFCERYFHYRSSITWTRGLKTTQIGGKDGEKDRPMGKSRTIQCKMQSI